MTLNNSIDVNIQFKVSCHGNMNLNKMIEQYEPKITNQTKAWINTDVKKTIQEKWYITLFFSITQVLTCVVTQCKCAFQTYPQP